MSSDQPHPLPGSDLALKVLMKIFSLGLATARHDDLEDILAAALRLHYDEGQATLAEVRLQIRLENWIGAVRLLKQIEVATRIDPALTSALLAGCLFRMGDAEWSRYAAKLLREGGSNGALQLLNGFLQAQAGGLHPAPNAAEAEQVRQRITAILKNAQAKAGAP
ncbi:HrpB1 family type III secretion system apparatus protein [Caldimonas brevitalea]|uniref:Type III secretion protein HrpB1 n=1 Tax=Caldimonas brevitalea TaxID=413882 RepID=A0A0G3BQM0_9BURK|nr:HrpB1 family type III secretion system apparatus protein [Caldimonas brevitalea]AKJ31739.1 hypothetical protein AAW51_5048 [Caldimonas brevitalea]